MGADRPDVRDPHKAYAQDSQWTRLHSGSPSTTELTSSGSRTELTNPQAEPQLVFFKPTSSKQAETNALITTKTGHEVSLSLVSEGNSDRGGAVDYVLKYAPQRSFLIAAAQSNFVIGDTKSLTQQAVASGNARTKAGNDEL